MSGEPILIEQHENYVKQTLRNRCTIDSPNGPLHLSIPIDKSTFVMGKCPMKDIVISTHSEWQRQHWYALETTYFNSPFFEYLQDDFRPIYERVRSVVPQGRKALRKERGTYCYQGVWEFIDHILVSPDLSACVDGTAHVAGYPFLLTENGIPFRTFRGPAYGGGYSDHLPLYMDLSPVKKE